MAKNVKGLYEVKVTLLNGDVIIYHFNNAAAMHAFNYDCMALKHKRRIADNSCSSWPTALYVEAEAAMNSLRVNLLMDNG